MPESQPRIDRRSRPARATPGAAPAACESLEHRTLLSGTATADAVDPSTTTATGVNATAATDVKTNNGNIIHQGIHGKFVGFP